ncbi:MAG: N-acetylneuraminate synthase family protein [Lachnospiraceae bacterium]|nr:N-acetylneuraminate synthase family protein [Lachnospiraceae bacterium]
MANKKINIGGYEITESSRPYMIAEIGINHNGDIDIAKKLMDAANATGWHSVKYQKRTPELAVPEAQKSQPKSTPWGNMTYLEYKYRVEFEKPQYDIIDAYCKDKGMAWSASPWDLPSLEFLLQYDVPYIKIASASNGRDSMVRAAAESKVPVIMSTGMTQMEEIDHAVEILEKYGNGDYILMHTNSAYPAPVGDLNLRMIQTLKDRFDCLVGYSGHEANLEPTIAAVVLGACVIERHVTLSHEMWGSDQKASLEVHAMDMLNKRIQVVYDSLGDGVKYMSESEAAQRKKLRTTD